MWLSSEIFYKEVDVYKKTWYGKKKAKGFELTKQLRWKEKAGVFYVLPIGYVWDGPSYMKILEHLLGKRDEDAIMASSAFHDAAKHVPVRYIFRNEIHHVKFNIKDAAAMYKEMADTWPDKSERPTRLQTKVQKVGLILLQPFYNFVQGTKRWIKAD